MTIRGFINEAGYAQIPVTVRGSDGHPDTTIEAIIDTGFQGALSLPSSLIAKLHLPLLGEETSVNFGGEVVRFDSYAAIAVLGDEERGVLCLSADNPPLVGMELLQGYDLFMELISNGAVTLTQRQEDIAPSA